MKKPRIIIEVSGGVVNAVYASQPIDCDVLDHDNAESGELNSAQTIKHQELKEEIWKHIQVL